MLKFFFYLIMFLPINLLIEFPFYLLRMVYPLQRFRLTVRQVSFFFSDRISYRIIELHRRGCVQYELFTAICLSIVLITVNCCCYGDHETVVGVFYK